MATIQYMCIVSVYVHKMNQHTLIHCMCIAVHLYGSYAYTCMVANYYMVANGSNAALALPRSTAIVYHDTIEEISRGNCCVNDIHSIYIPIIDCCVLIAIFKQSVYRMCG